MGTQIKNNIKDAQINENDRATTRVATTLGDIIGAFKSLTTNEYIKNQIAHDKIIEYIKNNPSNWTNDKYHNEP